MIVLDYKDRRPIYEQVTEKLKELMLLGIIEANHPLPSVRSLATDLSINPNTIQRAYSELERQGYIYTVKGKGSFVAENSDMKENKKKEILGRFHEVVQEASNIGIPKRELAEELDFQYGDGKHVTTGGETDD